MNGKQLLRIDNFTGMGEGGVIYNEGFEPRVENGKSVLSFGYSTNNQLNNDTTNFSDLGNVLAMIQVSLVSNFALKYRIYTDGNDIFSHSTTGDVYGGKIHTHSDTTTGSDLLETSDGNILYSTTSYVGVGYRSKATGGSTTTIIDTTKDFVALGIVIGDKVTNLKTGKEYPITGVAATTLTFVAIGTSTTGENDEYIVWDDNKFNLTTGVTRANWQPYDINWVRQIKQYGDEYYVLNGNYLAKIAADLSAMEATYKRLPFKHQGICFSVNSDKIEVSAKFNNAGRLLIWDGHSDGWNNWMESDVITALTPHKNGWVFVSKGEITFTDGYQTTLLAKIDITNNFFYNIQPASYNGLLVSNDVVYFTNTLEDYNRLHPGVIYWNFKTRGGLVKCNDTAKLNGSPLSLAIMDYTSGDPTIYIGGVSFISYIYVSPYSTATHNKSYIVYASLGKACNIKGIGLELSQSFNGRIDQTKNGVLDIQVNVGDSKRGLFSMCEATNVSTNQATVNGTTYLDNQIGDELLLLDNDRAGERTFITAKQQAGTASELLTLSPVLSGTAMTGTTKVQTIRVKKFNRLTVTDKDMNVEKMFYGTGIQSDKLIIEIVVHGNANSFNFLINSINVYGE